MADALKTYEPKSNSVYLRFKDGDEVKLRVLTLDPVISEKVWPNSPDKVDTKYGFVVWNWNENKAMVWQVTPGMLNRFTRIHRDDDFDDLNKLDIKVSASGEMLERRYEVQVLQKAQEMTPEMVKEASELDLSTLIPDNRGRLSEYDDSVEGSESTPKSGYDKAKEASENLKNNKQGEADNIAEVGDEPISLDDIPF